MMVIALIGSGAVISGVGVLLGPKKLVQAARVGLQAACRELGREDDANSVCVDPLPSPPRKSASRGQYLFALFDGYSVTENRVEQQVRRYLKLRP